MSLLFAVGSSLDSRCCLSLPTLYHRTQAGTLKMNIPSSKRSTSRDKLSQLRKMRNQIAELLRYKLKIQLLVRLQAQKAIACTTRVMNNPLLRLSGRRTMVSIHDHSVRTHSVSLVLLLCVNKFATECFTLLDSMFLALFLTIPVSPNCYFPFLCNPL